MCVLTQGRTLTDEMGSISIFDEQKNLTEKMAFESGLGGKVKIKLANQVICRILLLLS